MKIPTAFLSTIETAINAWLKLDSEIIPRFAEFDGKIIRLHITGLDLNLYFMPNTSGIQVLGNYPSEADGGIVDATIHGSPMALIKLSTSSNAGETMLKTDVEIEGDMRVAETFSAILKDVDIDWEELLSKLVGDIVAHQTGQVARSASNWFKETIDALQLNTAEYITEEAKLSPSDAEVRQYMEQVDNIRSDVDRLTARINNLEAEYNKNK